MIMMNMEDYPDTVTYGSLSASDYLLGREHLVASQIHAEQAYTMTGGMF